MENFYLLDNLDSIILEMTKETQALTVEWVFRAIEKKHGN